MTRPPQPERNTSVGFQPEGGRWYLLYVLPTERSYDREGGNIALMRGERPRVGSGLAAAVNASDSDNRLRYGFDAPVSTESTIVSLGSPVLQDDPATVLVEVVIERDHFPQTQAFHHDEAQCIAERVFFVGMAS